MSHTAMSLMIVIAVSLVLTVMAGTVAIDRSSRLNRKHRRPRDADTGRPR